MGATLMALSAIGLVVPALFHQVVREAHGRREAELSLEIAVVLFATYLLSLVFSLRTHKHLYDGIPPEHGTAPSDAPGWSNRKSGLVLVVAALLTAFMSELLVGAVQLAAKALGLTEVFVGVILVAIIGNAAEHSTAVLVAYRNKMDLAVNIAIGSSIQIALFVAPVLVFVSHFLGRPMDLIFTTFEVVAVALSVGILALVAMDGESNWMEGVMLVAVYLILGLAFFFLP